MHGERQQDRQTRTRTPPAPDTVRVEIMGSCMITSG
jgi:hypothetical protein